MQKNTKNKEEKVHSFHPLTFLTILPLLSSSPPSLPSLLWPTRSSTNPYIHVIIIFGWYRIYFTRSSRSTAPHQKNALSLWDNSIILQKLTVERFKQESKEKSKEGRKGKKEKKKRKKKEDNKYPGTSPIIPSPVPF